MIKWKKCAKNVPGGIDEAQEESRFMVDVKDIVSDLNDTEIQLSELLLEHKDQIYLGSPLTKNRITSARKDVLKAVQSLSGIIKGFHF
jgi:hypothetical protein